MAAFSVDGCLTDVVNLLFAMANNQAPDNQAKLESTEMKLPEEEVLKLIEETKRKIHANELAGLWIPTHVVHDCEVDDRLCWLLLEYLHRKLGTELTVLCQVRGRWRVPI